ncbi:amidohydrolase [Candidatus Woesearchaeota archaeon]|nr:amidohydrolase [Candidatus Woesearchaeota archaeon]
MLIKNCRYLLTQNKNRDVLENVDILIMDNLIARIAENIHEKENNDKVIIFAENKIVMPGLINTHTHLGMHSLKGICDDKELHEWLDKVTTEEKKLTKEQVLQNTENGIKEAVRFGTTTIYDSYKYALERAELFQRLGVRACISETVHSLQNIPKAEQFVEMLLQDKKHLVTPIIAAHAIFSTNEDVLKAIIDLSEKYNVIRRLHLGETRRERFEVQQKTGKLPVEYLHSLGFLNERALLVHCIWLTKGEIKLLAKTQTKVSHNPISNMKLASGGIMPLIEIMEEGVVIGLGTDSVVSNNNLDLFEELKITPLLHKQYRWDPKVITPQEALDFATIDGAKVLMLDKEIGSIEVGKKADIITIDIAQHMIPLNNVLSNIVYCANGNDVCDVVIDGKIIVKDKQF